jgi:hypothetical protein
MKAMLEKPLDTDLFSAIAEQLMSAAETISVDGRVLPVRLTGRQQLRCVRFSAGGTEYEAIEQNAAKPSRWGQLAREGHRVVQFRDVLSDRYVAVSVDGRVTIYGR